MTPNDFKRRVKAAKKGEKIRYFRGFTGDLEREADELRRTVAKAFIDGDVTLVQRKTGIRQNFIRYGESFTGFEYDYLAIRL